MKLSGARFKTNKRRCLFTPRVVKLWSSFLWMFWKQNVTGVQGQKLAERNLLRVFKWIEIASNSGSPQAINGWRPADFLQEVSYSPLLLWYSPGICFGPYLNWDAGLDGCSVWLSATALVYIFVIFDRCQVLSSLSLFGPEHKGCLYGESPVGQCDKINMIF